jgi:hypothetical protein
VSIPAGGSILAPAELAGGAPTTQSFTAMGEDAGTLEVERREGDGGVHVVERVSMDGSVPWERESYLRRDADGSIILTREVNHEEKVVVDFEPGLVVYPARISAGGAGALEQRVHMTVHPMRDPAKVQAQGEVKHTIRWEGAEQIQTPRGPVEAMKLVSVFEADLGGPQVLNETQEWLAPGMGAVAKKKMERTTMLGLKVRAKSEWWVVR